jgi:hypothetical protein
MTLRGVTIRVALIPVLACETAGEETAKQDTAAEAPASAPADSLVMTGPDGSEIWFTLSRESKAADGTTCVDRTMEIRRGNSRIPVPLLYTGTAPELVNDSTIRARLSNQCVPGDVYLVNLHTGRPVRER